MCLASNPRVSCNKSNIKINQIKPQIRNERASERVCVAFFTSKKTFRKLTEMGDREIHIRTVLVRCLCPHAKLRFFECSSIEHSANDDHSIECLSMLLRRWHN